MIWIKPKRKELINIAQLKDTRERKHVKTPPRKMVSSTIGAKITLEKIVKAAVILTDSGIKDVVYNDFYIGENADVEIIAGCGIHNDGCDTSQHDGIHTFHIAKNAKVRYVEKHYGEGNGRGGRILNPGYGNITNNTYHHSNQKCYCK